MKRDEIIEGVVLFLCGAGTVALSLQMPIGTFRMAGSGLFPLCLGIALMLSDTILATKEGPEMITRPILYPTLSVEAGGIAFVRPDILSKD